MARFDSSIATALRLIQKNGETSTIFRRADTPPDSSEPWNQDSTETQYAADSVWLDASLDRPSGSAVQSGDQIVLVAASGLTITPDASMDRIERESGESWSIIAVRTLNPNGQQIIHELHVRQ
jgi:hypothetical protein